MANDDKISVEGSVTSINRGGLFGLSIRMGKEDKEIIGRCSGRMRKFNIRLVVGDPVRIELSPYDLSQGIIVRRL